MRVSDVSRLDPPGITNQLSSTAEPVGSIDIALAHAARLLRSKPHLAAAQAEEILKVARGHPVDVLLLGTARRLQGDTAKAIDILETLAREQPNWPAVHYELGLTLS